MPIKSSFHQNVFLLTQVVPPSKDFQKYFKRGMFDKPNTQGFLHVSHYLLTIYDEERFKRAIDWPILDKKSEAKYRTDVKEFLSLVTDENGDIECPSILASYLLTASGTKFITLMWKVSQIVLRTYLKRTVRVMLGAPKPDNPESLTKLFFNNTIAKHENLIKEMDIRMKESESKAKNFAKETVDYVETVQSELFEARKQLTELAEIINVHVDIKKRIVNTSDTKVIELWKKNIQLGTDYLKQQVALIKSIEEKSIKVNNLLISLFSDSRKILDGKNLPKINVSKLMEMPLEPEAKVALHHLYTGDKLSLNNFLFLLNSVLRYRYTSLNKNGFPDLSECKLQIQASTEDLKRMCTVIDKIQNRLMHISDELRNTMQSSQNNDHRNIFLNQDYDNTDTILLKASPKIQFNTMNLNSERHDVQERLKLTPVEAQHRSLFARYKTNSNIGDLSMTPVRPKIPISRINFDDTLLSPNISKFSGLPKRTVPIKIGNQSTVENRITKKYARLFGAHPSILVNSSVASTSSWKASTFIEDHNGGNIHNMSDIRSSGNIYNMSDLRAQLATTSSTNVCLDLPTPIKYSSESTNIPPNTLALKDIDKPSFNSSEVISDLQTISETTEINIGSKTIRNQNEPEKRNSKRLSISDLVERYKKIRDQSICISNPNFENVSNDKDE